MNQNVNEALSCLENESKQLLKQSERMFHADHGKLYPFDFLVIGVIKRTSALSEGFSLLIREKNFICAGAIIRMHLDTALRLSAGFRVDSPHDFARKIMEGH